MLDILVCICLRTCRIGIIGGFSDFKFSFPENNYFYQLQQNGVLIPHSLMESPKLPRDVKFDCQFCETVLEYTSSENEKVFLPNNDQPSIFLKCDSISISDIPVQEKDWESGLGLQAAWLSQTIHPEIAEDLWLPMVKSSFLTKIMTPSTSYLVVENEAQKAVLRNKQKLVLAGNKNLDLNDDTQQMSEPSWWIVVILFGVYFWRKQKKMA